MGRFGGRFWDKLLLVAGLLLVAAVVVPRICSVNHRYREAQVRRNCRIVQYAAEEFARRTDGRYPVAIEDRTDDGVSFASLLPGGSRLRNPFTSRLSEPVLGRAVEPGQTGYRPVFHSQVPRGYVITGCGNATDDHVCVLTGSSAPSGGEAGRLVSLSPENR